MKHYISLCLRIKTIARIFKFLFSLKWTWRKPAKCDVLIFDHVGSEALKQLFDEGCRVEVLCIRGESLNLRVLFNLLWMRALWKRDIRLSYAVCYINYIKPKLVITHIDNSKLFYELSTKIFNIKTGFIQNGTRGIVADIFETIKVNPRYHVDFMFVHGEEIGKLYSKYIKGKVIPIGSIKNNLKPYLFNQSEKKNIAFISQWFPRIKDDFLIKTKDYSISHEKFYLAESIVLSFLSEWCEKNEYELTILGREMLENTKIQEHNFYKSLIKNKFIFSSRSKTLNSYDVIDQFKLITGINSTLVYECLARGKKTAAFTIRGPLLGIDGTNFGWPGRYEDIGPFWTNRADESDFKKIMDYLRDISDKDWSGICSDTMKNIISHDPGNKIIKKHLRQILE